MNRELDTEFEVRHDRIWHDLISLSSSSIIFFGLYDAQAEYFAEMNISPNFYHTVSEALRHEVVVLSNRLFYDTHPSNHSFDRYIDWVENNLDIFSREAKRERKELSKDDWRYQRSCDLTKSDIENIRAEMQTAKSRVQGIKKLRDEDIAHLNTDKHIMRNKRFAQRPSVSREHFNELFMTATKIMNKIGVHFDGSTRVAVLENSHDFREILIRLRKYRESRAMELEMSIQELPNWT